MAILAKSRDLLTQEAIDAANKTFEESGKKPEDAFMGLRSLFSQVSSKDELNKRVNESARDYCAHLLTSTKTYLSATQQQELEALITQF